MSKIFSERERDIVVVVRPSVCRLYVTFVRPTQAIKIFGSIFTPFGTLAIYDLCKRRRRKRNFES